MAERQETQVDTRDKILVIGMGKTGLSCVRFLLARGLPVMAWDNRDEPPALAEVRELLPADAVVIGDFSGAAFSRCRQLVVSPGVSLQEAALQAAAADGVEIVGDIELFARHVDAPVIAITGSNGKSTVTALVAALLIKAGCDVRIGGNFGTPALALLGDTAPDVYVLELSSFQLETTMTLNAAASVVLNVSPDHMDRYADVSAYARAKQRVWNGDGIVVVNRDEPAFVSADLDPRRRQIGFTLDEPAAASEYGIRRRDGREWLARGSDYLVPVAALKLAGRHNVANALAALALADVLLEKLQDRRPGVSRPAMLAALGEFSGLPHRMSWVAAADQVDWYDDSKATNVGATLAALQGLERPVVLIAGGLGKGGDFAPLRPVLATKGRAVILIGRDAALIESALAGAVPCLHATDMNQAVTLARQQARPGDIVLLSPACASFDMFDGYDHRGRVFAETVRRTLA